MNEPVVKSETASANNAGAAYRVVVKPGGKRVRVVFAGVTIADSTDAVVLHETRLPPVWYFPKKDVRMEYL